MPSEVTAVWFLAAKEERQDGRSEGQRRISASRRRSARMKCRPHWTRRGRTHGTIQPPEPHGSDTSRTARNRPWKISWLVWLLRSTRAEDCDTSHLLSVSSIQTIVKPCSPHRCMVFLVPHYRHEQQPSAATALLRKCQKIPPTPIVNLSLDYPFLIAYNSNKKSGRILQVPYLVAQTELARGDCPPLILPACAVKQAA